MKCDLSIDKGDKPFPDEPIGCKSFSRIPLRSYEIDLSFENCR